MTVGHFLHHPLRLPLFTRHPLLGSERHYQRAKFQTESPTKLVSDVTLQHKRVTLVIDETAKRQLCSELDSFGTGACCVAVPA